MVVLKGIQKNKLILMVCVLFMMSNTSLPESLYQTKACELLDTLKQYNPHAAFYKQLRHYVEDRITRCSQAINNATIKDNELKILDANWVSSFTDGLIESNPLAKLVFEFPKIVHKFLIHEFKKYLKLDKKLSREKIQEIMYQKYQKDYIEKIRLEEATKLAQAILELLKQSK